MSENEQGRSPPPSAPGERQRADPLQAEPAVPPPSFVPMPGNLIGGGRFELVEKLGAGAMGVVFRAWDRQLARAIAIKFILPVRGLSWARLVEQLEQEARATARLNHENIVRLFDLDTWNGTPFLVMELLQGHSLRELLSRERLAPRQALGLLIDVARGLSHAHANGVIHRDLKPSNVFILEDGRAKILDFGLARSFQGRDDAPLRPDRPLSGDETFLAGTPTYMSPEQWRREPQDGRTDVWAMGVLLYEMLTGAVPYTTSDLRQFISPTLPRLSPPSVRAHFPELPEEADRIVARALSAPPSERYPSAGEMLEALAALDRRLREARPPRATPRPRAEAERRLLTLLCCSLSDPGPGGDPEEVADVLRTFHHLCAEAIELHEGTIATSVSGQLLACFGYPMAEEDDAARAVQSGLQIARTAREAEPRLELGIGIHTGLVVVQDERGIPALQGDAPGVAAWLSARAERNGVLMSERTHQLVPGMFTVRRASGLTPPTGGQVRLVKAWHVASERSATTRFKQTAVENELSPLVGRQAELDRLLALWEEARQGRGRFALVSGEPGLGKSRIVHELGGRVGTGEGEPLRLTLQCWSQLRHSPLYPAIELVRRFLGIRKEDSPAERLRALEKGLAPLHALRENIPLFASLLSIPLKAPYVPLDLSAEQQKRRTLEALSALLLGTAERRPMLLVVEDAHWADHTTLELLNLLFLRARNTRILVVVTFRPDFRPPWPEAPHRHLLALERLPAPLATAMVKQSARSLPPEVVQSLVERADGVPLYLEHLTRAVLEAGSPKALDVPDTLQDLLLVRLDRLAGTAREVAQLGAVVGREFSRALLQRLWTQDEAALQGALERLVEAGLLARLGEPGEEARYGFKHTLIQETAYLSLLKRKRQQLHQQVARALEEGYPELVEAQPELVAHHHAEGGNAAQAIGYLETAGQRALQRWANPDAVDHYSRALQLLMGLPWTPERDRRELALRLALGAPLATIRGIGHPDVQKLYARAWELCPRGGGGDAQLAPALHGLWHFYVASGQLRAARELSEQLITLTRDCREVPWLVLGYHDLATSALLQGEVQEALAFLDQGLALYNPAEHRSLAVQVGYDPGVAQHLYAAWALWLLGRPDQAFARAQSALDLALALAQPTTITIARCFLAMVYNHRGEHEAARREAEVALTSSLEHRLALWEAWSTMERGHAQAGLGALEEGLQELDHGIAGWLKTGARAGMTYFLCALAELCLRTGRSAEGMQILAGAAELVERGAEHFYEPELFRLKGELTLAMDPQKGLEAGAFFQQGLELARRHRTRAWELRLVTSLAALRRAQGRAEEGLRELAEVVGRFSEGFGTADLLRARALLGTG